MRWPRTWYGTGPVITESEVARIRAGAAARGEGIWTGPGSSSDLGNTAGQAQCDE